MSRSLLGVPILLLLAACGSSGDDSGSATGGASGGGGFSFGGNGGTGATGTGASTGTGAATNTGGAGNPGDAEPAAMNGMTAAHNAARAGVNPPASAPIPPLAWSGEIAAVAQAYADLCVFEHSSSPYGENLYASTGQSTPGQVVDSWVSEVQYYNYSNNSCSNVCGHYTQVVWAKSLKLGCGTATCTQNSPFGGGGSWQIWVCNYDPPGNYGGQKPY